MSLLYNIAWNGLLLQQASTFSWTYIWLTIGGLLLALMILAFAYLLAQHSWGWQHRLLGHPVFSNVDQVLSDRIPRLWSFIRRRFTIQQWHGLALTVAIVFIFAAVYLFVLITESWAEQEALYRFDQRVYTWLIDALDGQMIAAMQIFTHVGDGLTITAISVLLGGFLLLRRFWWQVVSLFFSVGVGAALMQGLKWIFERSRPTDQLAQAAGHSFPSGHTFLAMTLYGFVIYLIWRFSKHDAVRIGATIVLVLLIFLVGLSRVILRVHWVSDVVGGFTIGLGWLICSVVLSRLLQAYASSRHVRASS